MKHYMPWTGKIYLPPVFTEPNSEGVETPVDFNNTKGRSNEWWGLFRGAQYVKLWHYPMTVEKYKNQASNRLHLRQSYVGFHIYLPIMMEQGWCNQNRIPLQDILYGLISKVLVVEPLGYPRHCPGLIITRRNWKDITSCHRLQSIHCCNGIVNEPSERQMLTTAATFDVREKKRSRKIRDMWGLQHFSGRRLKGVWGQPVDPTLAK